MKTGYRVGFPTTTGTATLGLLVSIMVLVGAKNCAGTKEGRFELIEVGPVEVGPAEDDPIASVGNVVGPNELSIRIKGVIDGAADGVLLLLTLVDGDNEGDDEETDDIVGLFVNTSDSVGLTVGENEGNVVGTGNGDVEDEGLIDDGLILKLTEGNKEGHTDGCRDGSIDGVSVGLTDG